MGESGGLLLRQLEICCKFIGDMNCKWQFETNYPVVKLREGKNRSCKFSLTQNIVLFPFSYPNLKSVRELIYKRGFGKIKKQRIPLTDNSLVEKSLGKFSLTSPFTLF